MSATTSLCDEDVHLGCWGWGWGQDGAMTCDCDCHPHGGERPVSDHRNANDPRVGDVLTGTVKTLSGLSLDLHDPSIDSISIDDIAAGLSQQGRYNGQLLSIYTVAEHSVRVANRLDTMGYAPMIVFTGLLHDAPEAYVGDVVRPLKRIPELYAVFHPIEDRLERVIHEALGGIYPHPSAVTEADSAEGEWERRFIRGLDPATRGWQPEHAKYVFLQTYEKWRSRL